MVNRYFQKVPEGEFFAGLTRQKTVFARSQKLKILHKDSERKKQPYCIAMIDIDHFKWVNDLYGHANGDLVLREFANLAKNLLRSSDIGIRLGGDEFTAIVIKAPGTP